MLSPNSGFVCVSALDAGIPPIPQHIFRRDGRASGCCGADSDGGCRPRERGENLRRIFELTSWRGAL